MILPFPGTSTRTANLDPVTDFRAEIATFLITAFDRTSPGPKNETLAAIGGEGCVLGEPWQVALEHIGGVTGVGKPPSTRAS